LKKEDGRKGGRKYGIRSERGLGSAQVTGGKKKNGLTMFLMYRSAIKGIKDCQVEKKK